MHANQDLRTQLILFYNLKEDASEAHTILVEAYMLLDLHNVDVRNTGRVRPLKEFEVTELQALLHEDDDQT